MHVGAAAALAGNTSTAPSTASVQNAPRVEIDGRCLVDTAYSLLQTRFGVRAETKALHHRP